LLYVLDTLPGIRRRHGSDGFTYTAPNGTTVEDEETIGRIKSLAIPPAWSDVWICPIPHGHLQATGRDGKRRKQYRYHSQWRRIRDTVKFDRMVAFGEALPRVRKQVEKDLALRGMPREKVLATVVRLLEYTRIRIGNAEYRRENESFGLTTLQDEQVDVAGARVRFQFRGKAGKHYSVELSDRRLARIVKRCQEIPGHELFQYVDEQGNHHSIESGDVNCYLKEISGGDFTAKDFRTWAATVLAVEAFWEIGPCQEGWECKQQVVRAVEQVAEKMGNTPAVCRKHYIHPAVIHAYLEGTLPQPTAASEDETSDSPTRYISALEQVGLDLLRSL